MRVDWEIGGLRRMIIVKARLELVVKGDCWDEVGGIYWEVWGRIRWVVIEGFKY